MKTFLTVAAVLMFTLSSCATGGNRYPANDDDKGHGNNDNHQVQPKPQPNVPRAKGQPDNGRVVKPVGPQGHPVVDENQHPVQVRVVKDVRAVDDIRNDPHNRIIDFHSVVVRGHWNTYYPQRGWLATWNLAPGFDWDSLTSVVCEAVNTNTNEFYPATGLTNAGWDWNDGAVNNLLGEALDDCQADQPGAVCIAADPACTPSYGTAVVIGQGDQCASEGGDCVLNGRRAMITFGSGDRFTQKEFVGTGSVGCNDGTFGDPDVGVAKSCYVQFR